MDGALLGDLKNEGKLRSMSQLALPLFPFFSTSIWRWQSPLSREESLNDVFFLLRWSKQGAAGSQQKWWSALIWTYASTKLKKSLFNSKRRFFICTCCSLPSFWVMTWKNAKNARHKGDSARTFGNYHFSRINHSFVTSVNWFDFKSKKTPKNKN